jgi:glycosyltransferase involved in cell wall biosynthesis
MLRVGVDAWNLPGDRRGIGRYVREILEAWHQHPQRIAPVLIVPEWHTWTTAGRYRREVGNAAFPIVSRALHRRAKLDVLWFPFNGCSWTTFRLPAAATLHDATPFVLGDYNNDAQVIMRNAAAHCRSLITDSLFSKAELAKALDIEPARLTPIPLGVTQPEPSPTPPEIAALKPYVLFVGTADRRKGIDVLLEAMRILNERYPQINLVIAGARGEASGIGQDSRVRELGFVDDITLDALYRNSALFAFPSRYEGFGLPVLEAMARGTPVVASDATSIPEAGGDAAVYVAPGDPQALAAAMKGVIGDAALAAALSERAR